MRSACEIRVRVEGKGREEYYSVRFFKELIGGVGAGMRVRCKMSIVLLEEGVEEGGQICHCMGVLCAVGKTTRVILSLAERKHVTVSSK